MKKIFATTTLLMIVLLPCFVLGQTKSNVHLFNTLSVVDDSSGTTTFKLGSHADEDTSTVFSIGSYPNFSSLICINFVGSQTYTDSLLMSMYLDVNWSGTKAGKWVMVDSITGPITLATVVAASGDTCYYRKWGLGKTFNGTSGTVVEQKSEVIAPYARFRLKTYAVSSHMGELVTVTLMRQQ